MTSNEDDCPFTYKEGEEPPTIEHPCIGTCTQCGAEAQLKSHLTGKSICFPCAYSEANWPSASE